MVVSVWKEERLVVISMKVWGGGGGDVRAQKGNKKPTSCGEDAVCVVRYEARMEFLDLTHAAGTVVGRPQGQQLWTFKQRAAARQDWCLQSIWDGAQELARSFGDRKEGLRCPE